MNGLLASIRSYLQTNLAWMYVLPIFFTALIQVKEADLKIWPVYGISLFVAMLIFSPVLWWAIQRDNQPSPKWNWWLNFIIFPGLLTGLAYLIFGSEASVWSLWLYGIIPIFGLELVWIILKKRGSTFDWAAWLARFQLEPLILSGLTLLALLITWSYNPVQDRLDEQGFWAMLPMGLGLALRIWGILIVFYVYYFVNHYVLVVGLLQHRGLVLYLLGLLLFLLVFYPLTGEVIHWLLPEDPLIGSLFKGEVFTTDSFFFLPFLVILGTFPFIVAYRHLLQRHELNLLKREKAKAELNLLKQQINPHFFFNTLNNLYALSLTKDQHTPEVILRLSELMRYVIYKGKEATVPIEEEVRYIEDFIQLQQLRLHQEVDYHFEKALEQTDVHIPPLLFITFVENAFKHGIEKAEGPARLKLQLQLREGVLYFQVENSVESVGDQPPGIGLENLKNRLVLQYPGRHEITTRMEAGTFRATLKIWEL